MSYDADFLSGGSGKWSFPKTTFSESFNLEHTRLEFEAKKNKYAKFREKESSPNGVLLYSNPSVHCGVPKRDEEVIKDRFLTTQQAAMGVGPKLDRSKLRSGDAPFAMGRSGTRIERGMKTSGLLGERFNDSEELARNNFVQRAWLPYTDPALEYRKFGVPKADVPEGVSLAIGDGTLSYDPQQFHGRTATITGNIALAKRGPSVYMDEDYFRIRKYPQPYPDTMMGYSDENGRIETPYEPKDKTRKHYYKSLSKAGSRSLNCAGITSPSAPDNDHTHGYIQFTNVADLDNNYSCSYDHFPEAS